MFQYIYRKKIPDAERRENEFGTLTSKKYLHKVQRLNKAPLKPPVIDTPSYAISFVSCLNYLILIIIGHILDFFAITFRKLNISICWNMTAWLLGTPSLRASTSEDFKMRIDDCFARPATGVPGRTTSLVSLESHTERRLLHLPRYRIIVSQFVLV